MPLTQSVSNSLIFVGVLLLSGVAVGQPTPHPMALNNQPIECGKVTTSTCNVVKFDRTRNRIAEHPPVDDPIQNIYVAAIRSSKILYSGTILSAPFSAEKCAAYDWRVVVLTDESSNILTFGPADVSEFCTVVDGENRIMILIPASVIWAEIYHYSANLRDPLRKKPGILDKPDDPNTEKYCNNEMKMPTQAEKDNPFVAKTDIRPCDRYGWLSFLYNEPAGTIYNRWTQPGASQGTISFTPSIGKVPVTKGGPPGIKAPTETINFDIQEYPSGSWGKWGYLGFPLTFEKANTPTANLDSLTFGLSYDIPFARGPRHYLYDSGKYRKVGVKKLAGEVEDVDHIVRFFIRPPDFRIQYGPEIATSNPHDINLVAAATLRLPIAINAFRQPSAFSIFPVIGMEGGNHVHTHIVEDNYILRKVAGFDSSLRLPFILTHAFLGDKPITIDFAWRTRYLSYKEPFTDYVSGIDESLTKQQRSYWRGSYIVPFSTLAQFKVTVQHGGLPPDFHYLGYSLNLGLTLGNPGYTEH